MSNDGIEDHPDLMDPNWQRRAEKSARAGLRKTWRRPTRPRRTRRILIPLVVLVALAGAGYGVYRWGTDTSEQYNPSASGAVGATTTAPTELPVYGKVDLAHPFDDTPAQSWAEGIAGLTAPAPGPVGAFSAQQTASAIEQVKQAINLGGLDPTTLVNHQTDKFLSLFAPDARDQLRPDVTNPAQGHAGVVFLAAGYHLLPAAPRMNGVITLRPGDPGELLVHVTSVTAYAFDPGTTPITGPGDIDVFERMDNDYAIRASPPFVPGSAGLWLDKWSGYTYSMACGASNQDTLAPLFSDRYKGTASSVPPGMFDPTKPAPTGPGDC